MLFHVEMLFLMHLSMFSPSGIGLCVCVWGGGGGVRGDCPRELDNFEKLGSNSLPKRHNFVSKGPRTSLQRTYCNFLLRSAYGKGNFQR